MPIDQAVEYLVNFGDPFKVARGNLDRMGVTEAEQEWILAIGALLENYPYNSQEIRLAELPAADLHDFIAPWDRTLRDIWANPPGLRDLYWEANKRHFNQSQQGAIEGVRAAFRLGVALHPWNLPWK
jgi:hypothetical protein